MELLKNTPKANANGTSFHGATIFTTVDRIKALLGDPAWTNGDKSRYNWILTWTDEMDIDPETGTPEKHVVTIYDWRERFDFSEQTVVEFHIGGFDKVQTWNVKYYLGDRIGLNSNLLGTTQRPFGN